MKRRYLTLPLMLLLALALLLLTGADSAAAQSNTALWFVSYWNNTEQAGDPVRTASEVGIDHDWGSGSPSPVVNPDQWSGRWTSYANFTAGTYRLTVTSDDGVRVFLGWRHVIVDWNKRPARTNTVTVSLTGGTYPMAVDYFDDVGPALLRVGWERIGPPLAGAADVTILGSSAGSPTPPPASTGATWYGEYFNSRTLTAPAVLVRYDPAIDFDWGSGSPAPGLVSADSFSIRWTGTLNLTPGRYRFTVTADDGVRLWVNNQLVVDRWVDQQATTYSADADWSGGNLPVRLEYYDHGGLAKISLTWTRIGPTAGTGGPATATVNVYALNVRTGPGTTFPRITSLLRGTEVTLLGRNAASTWLYVQLPDNRLGWMFATYLTPNIPITDLSVVSG